MSKSSLAQLSNQLLEVSLINDSILIFTLQAQNLEQQQSTKLTEFLSHHKNAASLSAEVLI